MTEPTPKEIDDLVYELRQAGADDTYSLARAVLAKWGTPAPRVEPVAWLNPWRADQVTTDYDAYGRRGIPLYTTPQPTQPQAGAVPQGWKAVPVNPTPEMRKAAKSVPDPNPPYPPHYGLVWDAMLAASPTPPAEQAAPKAAPGVAPLTDEQRNAIYDKHCFLGDNGWEINWWQVIDEVEAAHGIKGGQHDAE